MTRQWFEINALSGKNEAEILIYDRIGASFFGEDTVNAKDFISTLKSLKNVDILTLRINSPGGNVFDGNAIYNFLREFKAVKNVIVDGLAASIASVIAMAGDKITMAENAMMMIHNPSSGAVGTAKEMRKTADIMDKVAVGLVAAYVEKTGQAADKIQEMMDDETWMTAKEAIEFGFANEMTTPVEITACFDLSDYKKVPETLKNITAISEKEKPMTPDEFLKQHPEIVAEMQLQGAKTERERIYAIMEQGKALPGHDAIVAEMIQDGKSSGPECAVRILAAESQARKSFKASVEKDAPPVIENTIEPTAEKDFMAIVNEKMAAEKIGKSQAISAIVKSHPDAHQKYITSMNKGVK